MKWLTLISLVFFGFILENQVISQTTCDVKLVIHGLRNNTGQVMVSVHLGPKGFPNTHWYRKLTYPDITAPTHTIILENIPYGKAAISILHDENKSGEMDYNFIHLPQEGFGFYRNYKVGLRAPEFDEVQFPIDKPSQTVEITVQY